MTPEGIRFKRNGQVHSLTPEGFIHTDDSGTATGSWTTQSETEETKNKIVIDIEGQDLLIIPAVFRFTEEDNRLEMSIRDGTEGIDSIEPYAFNGQIVADDRMDLRYRILTTRDNFLDEGKDIILYGDLEFESVFRLKINLVGGGTAVIEADYEEPVEADFLDRLMGDDVFRIDRLRFIAFTWNYFSAPDGKTIPFPERAKIDFMGDWGLSKDGLVFKVGGGQQLGGEEPELELTLTGKYKAVSAGMNVSFEDGDLEFDLLIGGEHEFKKEGATAFWQIAVGYKAEKIQTRISGAAVVPVGDGSKFKIGGQLTVVEGSAQGLALDLELEAAYEFKNGAVLIKAKIESGAKGLSYQIQLDGKVRFLDGELHLALDVGDGTLKSLVVSYSPGMDSILTTAGLEIKPTATGFDVGFNFEIGFTWANGMFLGTDYKTITA